MKLAHRTGSMACGRKRTGAVVPLVAIMMVALIGFLALAIDLGMLAISKVEAQNAADLAALTAARTLNGPAPSSQALATTNAQTIVGSNVILSQPIQPATQMGDPRQGTWSGTPAYGSYDYNANTQTFNANFPATPGAPISAVWVQVRSGTSSTQGPGSFFAGIFGATNLGVVIAQAQAVQRPRDIAMIMDLSNSMRFGTCQRFDYWTPGGGANANSSNNPDTVFPQFMQYSSASAAMQGPSTNRTSSINSYTISPANVTTTTATYAQTYINSFFGNNAYATPLIRAFDSYTGSTASTLSAPGGATSTPQLPSVTSTPAQFSVTPGGDVPLFKNGSNTIYATNVNDAVPPSWAPISGFLEKILMSPTTFCPLWELDGYSAFSNGVVDTSGPGDVPKVWTQADYSQTPFYGYTQGPGYYGKTFFIWPPDPRSYMPTSYNSTLGLPNPPLAGSVLPAAILSTWLNNLGMTNPVDQLTVTTNWNTWTLTQLQNWMTTPVLMGGPVGGPYTPTSTTLTVPGSGGKAPIYYAVCRLYNRAFPAGGSSTTGVRGIVYNPAFIADWRVRFFSTSTTTSGYSGPLNIFFLTNTTLPGDTALFSVTNGSLNVPAVSSGTLTGNTANPVINYNAILAWIQNTDASGNAQNWYAPNGKPLTWTSGNGNQQAAPPNPFPSQLRAGRIKYYGSIPTSIPSPAVSGNYPNFGGTTGSYDARFWKECIDYMLGITQSSSTSFTDLAGLGSSYQLGGYNADFTWGTTLVTPCPVPPQSISYLDNPARGQLRYWFGPLMMADYLANSNWNEQQVTPYNYMDPGDGSIAPAYSCKQAFTAAVNTMRANDWFTLIDYNNPRLSLNASGSHNCVACPLGTNYNYALGALTFPFSTMNADGSANNTEVTPYDADPATGNQPSANFQDIPRPYGSTCFAMGLMLAYNQFVATPTTDTTLRTYVKSNGAIQFAYGGGGNIVTPGYGMAGGLGRKGAQKVIIFETDGEVNYPVGDKGSGSAWATAPTGILSGSGYSPAKYYEIRYDMNNPSGSEYPIGIGQQSTPSSQCISQVTSIIKQMGGAAGTGGGGDFGSTRNPFRLYAIGFGPVFQGPNAGNATATLTQMQQAAGVSTAPTIVTGTDTQMTSAMTTAFTNILQNGVQVALIK